MNQFAQKLRELRIAKRMSQEELGDVFGVTRASVSQWEKGVTVPSLENLMAIARFFNVPFSGLTNTPSESISVDAALKLLPDDLQSVLRQSFLDTIKNLGPPRGKV